MASDRKQINVRASEDTRKLMERLLPVVSAALGVEINQSDLVRLGLVELEKKYLGKKGRGK